MADGYLSTDPNDGQALSSQAQDAVGDKPSDSSALALSMTAHLAPAAQRVLEELATNPGVKQAASALGQAGGGLAGMVKAGPVGAASGMWAGGKAGWRLANMAQKMTAPVAALAAKAAPYAQTAATLSGVQGALDVAQMADPDRKDIGFLGIGKTQPKVDTQDPGYKAKQAMARAAAIKWAEDHPSPSVQGLKNAFADMIAMIRSHVEGKK